MQIAAIDATATAVIRRVMRSSSKLVKRGIHAS
jgi:hypothetical protein